MENLSELYAHPTADGSMMEQTGQSLNLAVDRIEAGGGIHMYLVGHHYPQKGLPTTAAVYAMNHAKRLVIEGVRLLGPLLMLIPRTRLMQTYAQLAWPLVAPHVLKDGYLSPQATEIQRIMLALLPDSPGRDESASILAHIIEYDAAYRFRLMDLMTETSKTELLARPIREIRRLLAINKVRDYQYVHSKFRLIGTLVLVALCIPQVRRAFRAAFKDADFVQLQFDEADAYWSCYKGDYDYFGIKRKLV